MSNAAGLKHVATEPAQLETKRERRRGTSARAAGRAAALRRAPSDSDCSGETASLSADSGDRSVRPAPPPPRTTKSRSRRRGSEWEVLEGLKDGQRFDKRPEVFNGYLHKKRKWPLKGWHKRFFVVDGGILVYARSPTDVARGRLHGSVDVGLSVISAKARRRRIDIDADEFIYHLRAKTPDLFRTWLNVLKTHRLYRQHLLTFGARESVPKIHAPLDELPPTENSSRATPPKCSTLYDPSSLVKSSRNCKSNPINSILKGQFSLKKVLKLGYEQRKIYSTHSKNTALLVSLCSWGSGNEKPGLDFSNQLSNLKSTFSYEYSIDSPLNGNKEKVKPITMIDSGVPNKEMIKENNTPAYFLFSGFKHDDNTNRPIVRKSRKATNVVKYKNKFKEPALKGPICNYMVLDKCKMKKSKTISPNLKYDMSDKKYEELKSEEKLNTESRNDALIETIMLSMFNKSTHTKLEKNSCLKSHLKKILKELYDTKFNTSFDNSIKELFRCLLEYWLKNTLTKFRDLVVENKSIEIQSNSMFMRNIATQIHGICDILEIEKSKVNNGEICATYKESATSISRTNDKRDPEEVIKSIIYVCQTMQDDSNKEKDIAFTKSLIKSLGSSNKTILARTEKNSISSDPSSELSQIRNTLNQLIREVAIPPDAAKDFLRLYLNLLHEQNTDSESAIDTNSSTQQVICDVETKSIERKLSKSISTERTVNLNTSNDSIHEPRYFEFKNVLDKIMTMFGLENREYEISETNSSNFNTPNKSDKIEESHTRKQNVHSLDLVYSITDANAERETRSYNLDVDGPKKKPSTLSYYDSDLFTTDVELQSHTSSKELNDIDAMQRKEPKLRANKNNEVFVKNLQSVNVIQKKLKLNTNLDSKNPNNADACNSNQTTRFNFIEDVLMFQNLPKIVNEKIILLLLNNLSSLSENVPHLHKDINGLYVKLHKKYEKNLKVQGLSLLGKIYNDAKFRDNETQCDECYNLVDEHTSTEKDPSVDEETNTSHIETNRSQTGVQYSGLEIKKVLTKRNLLNQVHDTSGKQTFSVSSVEIIRADKTVSKQIWQRTSLAPDCIINQDQLLNNDNKPETRFAIIQIERKEPMKEPSSLKTSTQSQTTTTLRSLRTKTTNKDCDIYQLFVNKPNGLLNFDKPKSDKDLKTLYRCSSETFVTGLVSPTSPPIRGPQAGFVSGTPGGRLASWIIESGGPLDGASRELGQAQLSVQQLQRLLDALELQQQAHHDTDVSLEGASPSVKKDRRKFGLRKKKSSNKCSSVELAPPHVDPPGSHTALSALTAPPSPGGGASSMPNSAASLPIACAATRPQSLPGAEVLHAPTSLSSLTPDHQLREDFTVLAKDLVATLKTIVATLVCERGRLRAAVEAAESPAPRGLLTSLRANLSSALHQNSELRSRLARIHDASDLADVSSLGHNSEPNRRFPHSLSYSSSCVSASEFFDAEEHEEEDKADEMLDADEAGVIELDGDSTSEAGSLSSEDGSASSDNSDAALVREERAAPHARDVCAAGAGGGDAGGGAPWTRRTRLPHPRPSPAPPSLWNLLYKNIGKDLSQISMPVTINEPLNMLQRLCEELEYSELLDAAAGCGSAADRCALVAAFAVSAYAATAHRAASKPFNPLLGETYECVRADRGFSFLAEQVSHHPPVSACHAESPRWVFWQEARIKTKFWGKSMEFQPAGKVHVRLLTTGDHYSWNKVTTCVHNLFGGQRWVDQYGDMIVTCHGTDVSCKLNFIKASSWSNSRHEVRGAVVGADTRLRLQGRWTEALHAGEPPAARCLWRPGAMPADHELYYGFTRFAMELNELEPGMREVLPPTDTRMRPDQRALEHGDVDAAERLKLQLEQTQRERRRSAPHHEPLWFRRAAEEEAGEETWVFAGEYWRARERGFPELHAPRLW